MVEPTRVAASSMTGRRQTNEDSFFADPDLGLFVVADGMGGYEGGDVASQLAVEVIREFFQEYHEDGGATWPYGLKRDLSFEENMVNVAIRLAHQAIVDHHKGRNAQMGTTVAVMFVVEDRVIIGHVGDSRIYMLRDGELRQCTRDHSVYNQLVDSGVKNLPPQKEFPHKNVLTKALGTSDSELEPDIQTIEPRPGDVFLMCTDGLCDVVEDEQLRAVLENFEDEDAGDRLTVEAYEQGSPDNITAVVVELGEDGPAEWPSEPTGLPRV